MQKISLTPTSFSMYFEKKQIDLDLQPKKVRLNSISKSEVKSKLTQDAKFLKNVNISNHGKKLVQKKINWLLWHTKGHGNNMTMITLTLPAKQMHTTKELNAKLLNNLLTWLRKKNIVKFYLWRLEFQANGNAHWHIIVDRFIDWRIIRGKWNFYLKRLGYIKEYRNNFENLTFEQYCKLDVNSSNQNKAELKKRYDYGVKSKWSNPNSIDVKKMTRVRNLRAYIGKYLTKDSKNTLAKNKQTVENNTDNFRLIGMNLELSKLKSIKLSVSSELIRFKHFLIQSKAFTLTSDFYFWVSVNYQKLPNSFRKWFQDVINEYYFEIVFNVRFNVA